MAFTSSKFTFPSYSGSGYSNIQDYTDGLLTRLKENFIAANNAWTLESGIETIGTNTDTHYGCRTLQLKSSVSGKYLRIWCFIYSASAKFYSSEGDSGSYNSLRLYKGNVFQCNYGSSTNYCMLENYNELYFGVSDSPINKDFGKDLNLTLPLFGISLDENAAVSNSSYISLAMYNTGIYYDGGTISIISDGKMFGVIMLRGNQNNASAMFYAPDMFICANNTDLYREGVIASTDQTTSFKLGIDNTTSATNVKSIFTQADGGFNFNGLTQKSNNGKDKLLTSASSTKMLTAPVAFCMYPYTYSGSAATGVLDGIGFKGWINTDYIRSASTTVLPSSCKGMTYGNGRWLCMEEGTLVCWDSANSSPFEA